nr:MAG TPA: hypothetical protein [Caudoviricetes sp.]
MAKELLTKFLWRDNHFFKVSLHLGYPLIVSYKFRLSHNPYRVLRP